MALAIILRASKGDSVPLLVSWLWIVWVDVAYEHMVATLSFLPLSRSTIFTTSGTCHY